MENNSDKVLNVLYRGIIRDMPQYKNWEDVRELAFRATGEDNSALVAVVLYETNDHYQHTILHCDPKNFPAQCIDAS